MAEQRILRLVDGPEAAGPDLADDAIARVEQVGGWKKTTPGFSQHGGVGSVHREQRGGGRRLQSSVASEAVGRLQRIGCSTLVTISEGSGHYYLLCHYRSLESKVAYGERAVKEASDGGVLRRVEPFGLKS